MVSVHYRKVTGLQCVKCWHIIKWRGPEMGQALTVKPTFVAHLCEPRILLKGSRVSPNGIIIWESSVQVHEPVAGGISYSNCNNHAGSPEGVTYVRAESGSALDFRARQRVCILRRASWQVQNINLVL